MGVSEQKARLIEKGFRALEQDMRQVDLPIAIELLIRN